MNNAQMSARVGLFFLLGVALIWVTFEALTSGKVRRDRGYRVIAHFSNLKELKAGDEVRMAGVKVGTIAETRLAGRRAEAVFLIDSRVQIAHDAVATIGMAGLLGANYVSLDLGTEGSGYLKADAQIRTADTPDLNTIVSQIGEIGRKIDDALSQFTGAIGGSNGNGLLGKIDRLVDENSARVGQITTDLRDITVQGEQGRGHPGPAGQRSLPPTNPWSPPWVKSRWPPPKPRLLSAARKASSTRCGAARARLARCSMTTKRGRTSRSWRRTCVNSPTS
jgi:phospholipid/cholesterol/gamma-HCH transport system substrate-binding protein